MMEARSFDIVQGWGHTITAISEKVETWIEGKGEVKMAKLEPRKSIFAGGCKASLPI